jgi:hypothetical protein
MLILPLHQQEVRIMRRLTRPLIVGALSFGLVAAAAAGTTFTIGTVEAAPITAVDADLIGTTGCDGTYDVEWTLANGFINGITATRTASTPEDDNLEYCADAFYSIYIAANADDGSGGIDPTATWVNEWNGTTDASGNIDASAVSPTSGQFALEEGTAVLIQIGPNAGFTTPTFP